MSDQDMLPLFEPDELDRRVQALRASAAPDLYDPKTYIPWREIERRMEELEPGLSVLRQFTDGAPLTSGRLAAALEHPKVLDVVRTLLVSATTVGFADGREIPSSPPRSLRQRFALAKLLLEVGLDRIILSGAPISATTTVGLIALDTRRRGFRRRDAIQKSVDEILNSALIEANSGGDLQLSVLKEARPAPSVLMRTDFAIADADGRPVAAIVTGIHTQSGGRQQSDLAQRYPSLQKSLDSYDIALIAIVDGQFIRDAPLAILRSFLSGVRYAMTVRQAQTGHLAAALLEAPKQRVSGRDRPALEPLITVALAAGRSVNAEDLPIAKAEARLALSSYLAQHPEQALELDPEGAELRSVNAAWRAEAYRLIRSFDRTDAIDLLADMLRAETLQPSSETETNKLRTVVVSLPLDRILPTTMLLAATKSTVDKNLFSAVARQSRMLSTSSALATLIAPDAASDSVADSAFQRTLATSVILITPKDLQAIAASVEPRNTFVQRVLQQADLTKANPFNATGATDRTMYFGRDEELAALLSALDTSSVSLLGGRRIGKTSFLLRSVDDLRANGWAAFYADCQAVGDWQTFASHVKARWNIELPREFRADNIEKMISELSKRDGNRLVIALDEIDYLLRWDQDAHDDQVTEGFFRACRSLSQDGRARFIFSGERLIAQKMWDPSSPHYNFCRPIHVRQLTPIAAADLLIRPLTALGVEVEEPSEVARLCWLYTGGHPHLVQYLGEGVVREINRRGPEKRNSVGIRSITTNAETQEFRQHYMETYWGQSTDFERLLTLLLAEGVSETEDIRMLLTSLGVDCDIKRLSDAMKMLELYGIIESLEIPIAFRSEWFGTASEVLGPREMAIADLARRLKK